MSFKTQAEIYQALLDGKKIFRGDWSKYKYIQLKNGNQTDQDGDEISYAFVISDHWQLYEEPEETKTFEINVEIDKMGIISFDIARTFKRTYKLKNLRIEGGKLLGDIDD